MKLPFGGVSGEEGLRKNNRRARPRSWLVKSQLWFSELACEQRFYWQCWSTKMVGPIPDL